MDDWRDIEGYEGSYQINIGGHVKSLPREIPMKGGKCTVKGGDSLRYL